MLDQGGEGLLKPNPVGRYRTLLSVQRGEQRIDESVHILLLRMFIKIALTEAASGDWIAERSEQCAWADRLGASTFGVRCAGC